MGTTSELLEKVLDSVELAILDGEQTPPFLIKVEQNNEVALFPLDPGEHPLNYIDGLVFPSSWRAFGCMAAGTAISEDGVDSRVIVGYILDRDGTSVGTMSGQPRMVGSFNAEQGEIPQACYRALHDLDNYSGKPL